MGQSKFAVIALHSFFCFYSFFFFSLEHFSYSRIYPSWLPPQTCCPDPSVSSFLNLSSLETNTSLFFSLPIISCFCNNAFDSKVYLAEWTFSAAREIFCPRSHPNDHWITPPALAACSETQAPFNLHVAAQFLLVFISFSSEVKLSAPTMDLAWAHGHSLHLKNSLILNCKMYLLQNTSIIGNSNSLQSSNAHESKWLLTSFEGTHDFG